MSELKGKVLTEVIAEGMGKLASMPSGKTTLFTSNLLVQRVLYLNCFKCRVHCKVND